MENKGLLYATIERIMNAHKDADGMVDVDAAVDTMSTLSKGLAKQAGKIGLFDEIGRMIDSSDEDLAIVIARIGPDEELKEQPQSRFASYLESIGYALVDGEGDPVSDEELTDIIDAFTTETLGNAE